MSQVLKLGLNIPVSLFVSTVSPKTVRIEPTTSSSHFLREREHWQTLMFAQLHTTKIASIVAASNLKMLNLFTAEPKISST